MIQNNTRVIAQALYELMRPPGLVEAEREDFYNPSECADRQTVRSLEI